jgi:integrase
MYSVGVMEWLRFHDKEFSGKELRQIRRAKPPNVALTRDEMLTKEKILMILQHSDERMRCFIHCLVSTGARISELVATEMEDIDLSGEIGVVYLRHTKNGRPRTVYLTSECVGSVKEWLKVRDAVMAASENRISGLVEAGRAKPKDITSDKRLFGIGDDTLRRGMARTLAKCGLFHRDRETLRATISPHAFRRYFSSTMNAGGVPQAIVEVIMGHEGYMSASYRRYDEAEIREHYRKAVPYLTLSVSADQYRKDVIDTKEQIDALVRAREIERARYEVELRDLRDVVDHIQRVVEGGRDITDNRPR